MSRHSPLSERLLAGIAYSLSSTSMLLVNKLAIKSFPETFLLLSLQNIGTLIIRYLWTLKNPERADESITTTTTTTTTAQRIGRFIPAVVLFMVMLFSSMRSLYYVSITTIIVFRNLNSLAVALGDIWLFKRNITSETWGSMFVIIIGAFIYANWDLEYHPVGYFWTFVNIGAMCGYSLYVKWALARINYSSMTMVLYNNSLSTPVFLLVSYLNGESLSALHNLFSASDEDATDSFERDSSYAAVWVLLSCTLSFTISASGFWAQKVFSPTTWITLNNLNKIPVILLSACIFQDNLSSGSVFGLLVSLIGGALYSWSSSQAAMDKAPKLKEDDPQKSSSV